ncbi:GtrA family protein [bacterium 1XD42-1]|nr:GtrA family protein [bacterium 1XD42-8]RKJ63557.1 GtrA family protein [bacterium 1XD42-1]
MVPMIKKIFHLFYSETFRYLVFGILTVVVNIAAYGILSLWMDPLSSNTLAFFLAVFFAYYTNTHFVFQASFTKKNFFQFMIMRIGTLFLDDGGMALFLFWGWNDLLAKCIVNGAIIVLNYLFSKLLIFRTKKEEPK